MAEQHEPNSGAADGTPDALSVAVGILAAQAFALDRLFYRTAKAAFSVDARSHHHLRMALKAQARSLATFKILLALRALAEPTKKFANFDERTIQKRKTPCSANGLEKVPTPAAVPSHRPVGRGPRRSQRWTPERRARQAAAIRTWQPWRKSTGPRTQEGKVRSAKNALKHGLRSRSSIESRREDRRTLRLAAPNIAAGKSFLRAIALKREPNSGLSAPNGLHLAPTLLARRSSESEPGLARRSWNSEAGSPNWYWPSLARADTVSPIFIRESRARADPQGHQEDRHEEDVVG